MLFTLVHKSADEVALNLTSKVFAHFGPPKILQFDNGREFVNTLVNKLVEDWPGEITIVNGRVRYPQSQGVVERTNAKVEKMLACHFHTSTSGHLHGFLGYLKLCKGVTVSIAINVAYLFLRPTTPVNTCSCYNEGNAI